ncbi:MAG: YlbF family regulator [Clostridia bacterium]|nr:YlbF family regulator [Clostridia bacterium]
MSKIIELAHALGEEIAKSEEIQNLEAAKADFEQDSDLQNKMHEYEAERMLLGQEFAKEPSEADQRAIADLRARIEQLSSEIGAHPKYIKFAEAQRAMNGLMAEVNAEIKYCITGERPSECTHDCSTCKGCH